jgi:hypothetical protein
MQTIETEVRAGLKTLRGAEGAAQRLADAEGIPGIRYAARPCAIRSGTFVVIRFDGDAMREPDSLTRPDPIRRFGGERDVASMRGKKARSRERGTEFRRVFA